MVQKQNPSKQSHLLISLLLVIGILISVSAFCLNALALPAGGLTDEQRAIQEVAMAYYRDGMNIQYESSRRSTWLSPEQITSQNTSYTVCSGFTQSVYYEALGMYLPTATNQLVKYGSLYYGEPDHPDIVFYTDDIQERTSTPEARADILRELMDFLQVGDVVVYYRNNHSGHALLIYDFVYDDAGNRVNAIVLNSRANFDKSTNKISKGLSWNDEPVNEQTGVDEGTIKCTTLDMLLENMGSPNVPAQHMTVLRPLALGDGTYNKMKGSGGYWEDANCTSEVAEYAITESAQQRLKYPGIEIEKTVDAFTGNTVEPGGVMTYRIDVTNTGPEAYGSLTVTENIPTDSVVLLGRDQTDELSWTIESLGPGQTETITYSVRVRLDNRLLGKEVISTGTVAGIPSCEIHNPIAYSLTPEQEALLKLAYNRLKGIYSGAELIDQVYSEGIGEKLNLSDLVLGAQYSSESDSNEIRTINEKCVPYFSQTDVNALINTYYGYTCRKLELNTRNPFSKLILNHYYSAVATPYEYDSETETGQIQQDGVIRPYFWEYHSSTSPEESMHTDRAMRVYPETLQTGDILLYANTNDEVTGESGTYAFIYLDDAFYGVNKNPDGTEKNVIAAVNGKGADNLQTLFAKDYYVILRPSIAMERPVPEVETAPQFVLESPEPVQIPSSDSDSNGVLVFFAGAAVGLLIGYAVQKVLEAQKKKPEQTDSTESRQ